MRATNGIAHRSRISARFSVCYVLLVAFGFPVAALSTPSTQKSSESVSYSVFHGKIANSPTSRAQLKRATRAASSLPPSSASLSEVAFQKTNDNQGLWKGRVRGSGPVELALLIFERGSLRMRKTIGLLELQPEEGAVSFHFRSPLPSFSSWSWKVVAAPSA